MSIHFPGGDDVATTVGRLRALADDLERLTMFRPRIELDGAPTIENWSPTHRRVGTLVGLVEDHPLLGNKLVVTSEVYATNPKQGWARTFSRFYRLGSALAPTKEISQ